MLKLRFQNADGDIVQNPKMPFNVTMDSTASEMQIHQGRLTAMRVVLCVPKEINVFLEYKRLVIWAPINLERVKGRSQHKFQKIIENIFDFFFRICYNFFSEQVF